MDEYVQGFSSATLITCDLWGQEEVDQSQKLHLQEVPTATVYKLQQTVVIECAATRTQLHSIPDRVQTAKLSCIVSLLGYQP